MTFSKFMDGFGLAVYLVYFFGIALVIALDLGQATNITVMIGMFASVELWLAKRKIKVLIANDKTQLH